MLEGPPPTLRQTVAGSRRQHGDKAVSKQQPTPSQAPIGATHTTAACNVHDNFYSHYRACQNQEGEISASFSMNAVYISFRRRYATLAHPNLSVKRGIKLGMRKHACIIHAARLNSKVRIAGKETSLKSNV